MSDRRHGRGRGDDGGPERRRFNAVPASGEPSGGKRPTASCTHSFATPSFSQSARPSRNGPQGGADCQAKLLRGSERNDGRRS